MHVLCTQYLMRVVPGAPTFGNAAIADGFTRVSFPSRFDSIDDAYETVHLPFTFW
jgi:hypothetical protein